MSKIVLYIALHFYKQTIIVSFLLDRTTHICYKYAFKLFFIIYFLREATSTDYFVRPSVRNSNG